MAHCGGGFVVSSSTSLQPFDNVVIYKQSSTETDTAICDSHNANINQNDNKHSHQSNSWQYLDCEESLGDSISNNLSILTPEMSVETTTDHKIFSNISSSLKRIGDNFDTSANDLLSTEIILALRTLGDSIDAKIGCHKQSFVKTALWSSRLGCGEFLLGFLGHHRLLSKIAHVSLDLLLQYSRI